MPRKLLALVATASSLVMATQAHAALTINLTPPTGTFESSGVSCIGAPCVFDETSIFALPAGYDLVGATITSGPALNAGQDVLFGTSTLGNAMTVTLNGTAFTLTGTGATETGVLFPAIPLLAMNTLRVIGTAGSTGQASYSGTLQFVQRAVPEPATWAMMLLGFGMIGFGLRRRSNVRTRVNFAMS